MAETGFRSFRKAVAIALGAAAMLALAMAFGLASPAARATCPPEKTGGQPLGTDVGAVMPAMGAVAAVAASPVDLAEEKRHLEAQGFRCRPPTQRVGLQCIGRIEGYSRDVALVIPPGYRPTPQPELILHLHGHNFEHRGAEYFLDHFQYGSLLARSGRNAILVAPLSYDRCAEFESELAPADRFRSFIDRVGSVAAASGLSASSDPGSVALTGHSGAYRSLAAIVSGGAYAERIRELYLFDSSYGRAAEFAAFASQPGHRFWSAYHEGDPDMAQTNYDIRSELRASGVPYYYAPLGRPPTSGELASNSVGFFWSRTEHDETVTQNWAMMLRWTSR